MDDRAVGGASGSISYMYSHVDVFRCTTKAIEGADVILFGRVYFHFLQFIRQLHKGRG